MFRFLLYINGMAIYRPKENFASPRHRRVNRISMRLLILTEIAAVILVGYLFLRRDAGTTLPVEGSAVEVAEIKSTKKYENSKFTLEHPNNWSYSKQESSEQEFVFRKYTGQQSTGVLTITLNKQPKDLRSTYVLPVNVKDGSIIVEKVSDHCKEFSTGEIKKATYGGAEFSCYSQTDQGILTLAQINGNQSIPIPNNAGKVDNYYFIYNDPTLSPNFDEAIEIIKSFKVIR